MELLEIFLATGPERPHDEDRANVHARAQLSSRSASSWKRALPALQALTYRGTMDRFWRKEARILQARSALALGQSAMRHSPTSSARCGVIHCRRPS